MTSTESAGRRRRPTTSISTALREKVPPRARKAAAPGRFQAVHRTDRRIRGILRGRSPHAGVVRDPISEDIDVAVLGGGIAGLLCGAYLKKAGVDDVRIIEMGGDFGGVWYWNRFPGIQCDNDAYCYIPLLEELGYIPTKKYADGAEIYAALPQHRQAFRPVRRGDLLHPGARPALGRIDQALADQHQPRRRHPRPVRRHGAGLLQPAEVARHPGDQGLWGTQFHSSRWDYDYTGGDATGGLDKLARQARRGGRHRCHRHPDRALPGPRRQASLCLPADPVDGRRAQTTRRPTRNGRDAAAGLAARSVSATFTAGPFERHGAGPAGSGVRLLDRTRAQHAARVRPWMIPRR